MVNSGVGWRLWNFSSPLIFTASESTMGDCAWGEASCGSGKREKGQTTSRGLPPGTKHETGRNESSYEKVPSDRGAPPWAGVLLVEWAAVFLRGRSVQEAGIWRIEQEVCSRTKKQRAHCAGAHVSKCPARTAQKGKFRRTSVHMEFPVYLGQQEQNEELRMKVGRPSLARA